MATKGENVHRHVMITNIDWTKTNRVNDAECDLQPLSICLTNAHKIDFA